MTSRVPPISVIVPTRNAGAAWEPLCRHLARMRERFGIEVLVIDSESSDGTVDHATRAGLRVHRIAAEQFGHGRTRNLGVEMTRGEVVCFLTQDVLPCTPDWPMRFARALEDPTVAGVYGRQVPRDATTMEMFFVALNYPAGPLRFDPQPGGHHPRPGRVLFSNAFSAIRRDMALRLPFVDSVPVSEDQVFAHQALAAGYSILYEPGAEALHAHRYTLGGLCRRTFLVGRALAAVGVDRGASFPESVRFLASELAYYIRQGHSHRLPQLLAYELTRWSGFQAGRLTGRLARPAPRDTRQGDAPMAAGILPERLFGKEQPL